MIYDEEAATYEGVNRASRGNDEMDYIGKIREIYNGSLQLHTPFEGKRADCVPDEIYAILCVSNGIDEETKISDTLLGFFEGRVP